MNVSQLRALFSHLVLVAVAPLGTVACGGIALEPSPGADAGGGDAASPPGDSASCTPVVGAQDGCGASVTFPCGFVVKNPQPGGVPIDEQTCSEACGGRNISSCVVYDTLLPGDTVEISCGPCGTGRRPAGLSPAHASTRAKKAANAANAANGANGARATKKSDCVGAWLAAASHLEAASVPAFEQLAEALARYGAPRTLVARARAAARDEVRHARVTSDLARSRGASAPHVVLRATKPASLARLAIENAVEGCVRETYGALTATWQAAHARDPEIAAAMTTIARDETRHAALALAIHGWASAQLSPAQRGRVERARRAAARTLLVELRSEPPAGTREAAGVPEGRIARALALGLERRLRVG